MNAALGPNVDDVVALTQQLIRNRCVNDGTPESGEELRNAELLREYLTGPGLDLEIVEAAPGRASLVVRVEGRDAAAPTMCWLGHTDVVPVSEERWRQDPFGGELVDGFVWGRGAVDMLNITASMAVALRRLTSAGWQPRGTLVFAAVADEEAQGTYGAGHLVTACRDAVRCDYLITESGGFPLTSPAGVRLPVLTEEKGPMWGRLRIRGVAGHGSMPFRTDNALLKAAEVVRRIGAFRPPTRIDDSWRGLVTGLGMPPELEARLVSAEALDATLQDLPIGIARMGHSLTHTTITPTVISSGTKTNMIPDEATVALDIRTLPGDGPQQVRELVREALGDLADDVDLTFVDDTELATASPVNTPLFDALTRVSRTFYPQATLLPMRMVGATDARFFRREFGTTSYGFGMFSDRLSLDDLASMGHGDDERIDVESLRMSVQMWELLARDVLS